VIPLPTSNVGPSVATKHIWARPPKAALVIGPFDRVDSQIVSRSLLEFQFYGLDAVNTNAILRMDLLD